MATLEETLRSLGLSAARGIPQLATGFVDLAALPFTATGMLKPEQAVGSTAYLTSKGLLPPEQQGLLNQTTELLSGAMNPAGAAKTIGLLGATKISKEAMDAIQKMSSQQAMQAGSGFVGSIKPIVKTGLPDPSSLAMPLVPTVEQMKQYGRVEVVPLSKAVSFQKARDWEKFYARKGAGDLVKGYGDKPLALRLENGEYVIYDGNHRADLALQKGKTEMPMNVIDVKSYDSEVAGRKLAPSRISDDELLNMLLGNSK
jgi:hypothetical protein